MCGRYVRRSDKQRIAEAFHLGKLPDYLHPSARLQHRPHHLPARHSPQSRNRRARNRHDALGPHPALRKVPRRRQRPQQHQRQGRDHASSAPCGASLSEAPLPRARRRLLRVAEDRRQDPEALPLLAQQRPALRLRRPLGRLEGSKHAASGFSPSPSSPPSPTNSPPRCTTACPSSSSRATTTAGSSAVQSSSRLWTCSVPSPPRTCEPRPPIKPSGTQRTTDPRC